MKRFSSAIIEKAKEDQRHTAVMEPLKKQLTEIKKNRDENLSHNFPRDEVLIKFSTVEVENAIRAEKNLHKKNMKPINDEINSTYSFVTDGLYDGYVLKVEKQKRGDFLKYVNKFLKDMGISEISQSALCKLTEQISDRLGVTVSSSKQILEDKTFSCSLKRKQFNKLFMSIFCDILIMNGVLECNFE